MKQATIDNDTIDIKEKLDKIFKKVNREPIAMKYIKILWKFYLDTFSIKVRLNKNFQTVYTIFQHAPKQYVTSYEMSKLFDLALFHVGMKKLPLKPTHMNIGVRDNQWFLVKFGSRSYAVLKNAAGCFEGRFFGKNCIPDLVKLLDIKYKGHASVFEYSPTKKEWVTTRYVGEVDQDNFIIDDTKFNETMEYIDHGLRIGRKLFEQRGIIKNPGLLLYGPPGTGKTTFVKLIASHFNARVYICSLGETDPLKALSAVSIEGIGRFPSSPGIILFEDIDVLCANRNDSDPEVREKFSSLLQILDGMLSRPGLIKVATTNHIEKLDKALLRGGRFGKHIELGPLNKEQAEKLCDVFNVSHEVLDSVALPIPAADLEQRLIEEWDGDLT